MLRKTTRALLIIKILLIAAGGVAAGIYFGDHNNGKSWKSDKAGSKSTGPVPPTTSKTNSTGSCTIHTVQFPDSEKSAAVNFGARFEHSTRQSIFFGFSYSAYGLGDNCVCPPYDDIGGICLLHGQVLADMRAVRSLTNRVKLYSLDCYPATQVVLEYAKANGTSVMLGIFISNDILLPKHRQNLPKCGGNNGKYGGKWGYLRWRRFYLSMDWEAISAVRYIATEAGMKQKSILLK
jgi:hypothetical protein